jgi:predicted nucleic-acid-binding Zn-ribbon protein
MMVLVGTRDSNVKNGIVSNEKCPKCGTENALHFSIYQRYTHLTLIPLFPVGKYVNIQCSNCKETFEYEDLSKNIQDQLKNQKLKSSIWMYTGSLILTLFIIFTINNYIQKKDETSVLIKNPIIGDVYNLKFSNGYYSSMRIDKVKNDSIYATYNDFDAYLPYEIDDIDKPENYSDRKVNYSKKDIIKLYKEDEIIEIKRTIKN